VKATVLHDEHGRIIAISKIEDPQKSGEINLGKELDSRPLSELHNEYRVDVAASKLVRKTEPNG
jgi:hypothetical protein